MRIIRYAIFGTGIITLLALVVVPWVFLIQGKKLPWVSREVPVSESSDELPELVLEVTVPRDALYRTYTTDGGCGIQFPARQSVRIVLHLDGPSTADLQKTTVVRGP